jgi:twitching motility protein PilT
MPETQQNIDALLTELVSLGGSDLHLTVGSHPVVRLHGSLKRLEQFPKLTAEDTLHMLYRIMSSEQQKRLETQGQIDMSYSIPGLARFRVNSYSQRESLAAAFRLIPMELKTLEELGLPPALHLLTH